MSVTTEPLRHYDPKKILVLINGQRITGFADGTFVDIAFPPSFTTQKGAQGAHTRTRVADSSATVTLSLQQTSPSNAFLSALALADELTNAPFVMLVKDLGGGDLVAGLGYAAQRPGLSFAETAGSRGWEITLHNAGGGAFGQV
jgi:hypothetical protein